MRYLTFALGKGRLANQTLELFEKIGITCEEMKDKNSRKLIFTNEELKLRFFLAKGPDVPTYVEYGAADIGVVGKDTILEEGRKVHEVLDLGYGKCKMCVCGYKDAAPLLQHHELIRVATKYPNIVETGSTLRENGLEVLEEVCPLSARMIVNPVSMRMESERIKNLLMKLRTQI